jgi:hypothetical protein
MFYHPCLAGRQVWWYVFYGIFKAQVYLPRNDGRAVKPDSLCSYLTAILPSLKASEKIYSLFSPLLVVCFRLQLFSSTP